MNIAKTAHTIVFSIFATGLIAAGTTGFLLPFGVVPRFATGLDDESLHLAQEAGSGVIALGLLAGWCVFNYNRSRPMQCILLVFFALVALLHWVDYFRGLRPIASGIINSIPTLVLMVLYVTCAGRDRDAKRPNA